MARASGRWRFNAETTSRPLPSPSRKSTTAKAGAAFPICARPSETLSHEVTLNPRISIARASRSRNGLSSSTINSERSAWPVSSAMAFTVGVLCVEHPTIWRDNTALPRPHKVDQQSRQWRPVLRRCFGGGFSGFKSAAGPHDLDHGAMIRKGPVGERHLGAGALQQRPRDEHAEPEPAALALRIVRAPPPRQIGLADPLQHIRRDAGSIVGNHDVNGLGIPPGIDLHGGAREVDGVLEDVADAVEDRRVAHACRLAGTGDCDSYLDRDAE